MSSQATIEGAAHVMQAHARLAEAGLAADGDEKGLNREGFDTLADLLSLVIYQAGASPDRSQQIASAAARAMMSALGDVVSPDSDGAQTLRLLAAATKLART